MEYFENIKLYRTENGFTQAELAEKIGVARQTVTRWENGWSVPSLYCAQKLAEVFGANVTELMTGTADEVQTEKTERNKTVKASASTARFCVITFLPIALYLIIYDIIYAARLENSVVQLNGSSLITRAYVANDAICLIFLTVLFAFWVIRLITALRETDDKYMRYRVYKLWNIGLAFWLINAVTALGLIWVYIVPFVLVYACALFIALPLDFVFDTVFKKAYAKHMVAERNKTLDAINLAYTAVMCIGVVALLGWIIYAVTFIRPTYGLEVGFAILYFSIGAFVTELSYIIVRLVVYTLSVRSSASEE